MSSHTGNKANPASSGGATQGSTMKSMMESAAGTVQQGIGSMTGNEEQKAKGAAKKAAAQNEKASAQYAKDVNQQHRHAAERDAEYNTLHSGKHNDPATSNLGNPQWKEGHRADAGMGTGTTTGTTAGMGMAGGAGGLSGAHAGNTGRTGQGMPDQGTHSHTSTHGGHGIAGQGATGKSAYDTQGLAGQNVSDENTRSHKLPGQSTHSHGQNMPGQGAYGQGTYGQTQPSSAQQFEQQAQQGQQFQQGDYHQQQQQPGAYSHTQTQSGYGDSKDTAYGASERIQGALGSAAAGLTGNRQEQERYNQMHDAGKAKQRSADVDRQTRSQAKAAGHDDPRAVPRSDLREDTTATGGLGGLGSTDMGASDLNTDTGTTGHTLRSDRRSNLRNDPSAY